MYCLDFTICHQLQRLRPLLQSGFDYLLDIICKVSVWSNQLFQWFSVCGRSLRQAETYL